MQFTFFYLGVSPPSPDDRQLAVRQSYPYKTKGVQNCEAARNKYVQTEVARVITAEGNVVKNMVDGSVEVSTIYSNLHILGVCDIFL